MDLVLPSEQVKPVAKELSLLLTNHESFAWLRDPVTPIPFSVEYPRLTGIVAHLILDNQMVEITGRRLRDFMVKEGYEVYDE